MSYRHFTPAEFHARLTELRRRHPECRVRSQFVANGDLHLSARDEDNTPRLLARWPGSTGIVHAGDLEILRDDYGVDISLVDDWKYVPEAAPARDEDDAVCADYAARHEVAQPLSAPQSRRRGSPFSRKSGE